jgi:predicted RNA-binding Zn-ribbon protein involved in translation (DUF1610 family)
VETEHQEVWKEWGGNFSVGVNGYCVCPNCGTKVKHERAVPCASIKCPNCGTLMIRE